MNDYRYRLCVNTPMVTWWGYDWRQYWCSYVVLPQAKEQIDFKSTSATRKS